MEISVQHTDRVVRTRPSQLMSLECDVEGTRFFFLRRSWETQHISPSVTPGKNVRKTLGLLVREPPAHLNEQTQSRRPDPPGAGRWGRDPVTTVVSRW